MATRLARTLAEPQARSGTGRTERRAAATSGPKYRHDRTVTMTLCRSGLREYAAPQRVIRRTWQKLGAICGLDILRGPYPFHLSQVSCSKLMAFPETLYLVVEALDESAQRRWRVAVEVRYTCLAGLRRSLARLCLTHHYGAKSGLVIWQFDQAPSTMPPLSDNE